MVDELSTLLQKWAEEVKNGERRFAAPHVRTTAWRRGAPAPRITSLLIKPASAVCNLDCEYCFYLDRDADPYRRWRAAA